MSHTATTHFTSDPGPSTGKNRWKETADIETLRAAWAIPAGGDELIDEIENGNLTAHCRDFVDECERYDRDDEEPRELNFDVP